MDIAKITSYRINDQLVWQKGMPIEELEAIINRTNVQPAPIVNVAEPEVETAEVVQLTTPAPKAVKSGSKKEKATEIYRTMQGEGKAAIIQAFMSLLDMTAAGAQTYYYNCKKEVSTN